MKYKIEGVNDSDILSISLKNILDKLELNFKKLNWRLLELEVVMKRSFGMNILELETFINKPSNGIQISYAYLSNFSNEIHQAINMLIIADLVEENLKRYDSIDKMHEKCLITIELIDGSYWEINVNNPVLDARIITLDGAKIMTHDS